MPVWNSSFAHVKSWYLCASTERWWWENWGRHYSASSALPTHTCTHLFYTPAHTICCTPVVHNIPGMLLRLSAHASFVCTRVIGRRQFIHAVSELNHHLFRWRDMMFLIVGIWFYCSFTNAPYSQNRYLFLILSETFIFLRNDSQFW
jgi:hypothetical protein